jgi:uncharacterized protein involved in response to NO
MLIKEIQETFDSRFGGVILSFPFRIFFLLAAAYAALLIPLWLCIVFLGKPDIAPVPILIWHSHEIVFGVVAAAIAGFMLTAICTWTGCSPLTNYRLCTFVLVWLAGRIAMFFPALLNAGLVAFFDLLFFALLFVYVSTILIRYKNWRNLPMSALLLLFLSANILIHWGMIYSDITIANIGKLLSLDILMLMLVFIGGRIIPAFTGNWLFRAGYNKDKVRSAKSLDIASITLTVLIIPAEFLPLAVPFNAVIPLAASFFLLLRLQGWQGWLCWKEPLLWILHLAYFWLVLAIFLKGLTPLISSVTSSVWIHALGLGAVGTMVIGVMTRVALGHTGRQLKLPRWSVISYYLITLSAFCRLLYGLGVHTDFLVLIASGLAWTAAFCIFLITYWPILSSKNVKGEG